MDSFFMTASHARGKYEEDAVFSVLKAAQEATATLGKDKVVDASIGAIFDDHEQFATLETVTELLRRMPASEMMNYAPISGLPDFLAAAIEVTFRNQRPEAYIKAVATPGGTGGVRHVFYNYTEQGSKILIPDWFWGPYTTIAAEHLRQVERYSLFNKDDTFNLASLEEKTRSLLKEQDNLIIVVNTPAHNPTGYSLSKDEWSDTLFLLKEAAKDKKKKITLLIDIAYIDYAGDPEKVRSFMPLFSMLPENVLVTIAFSMSKSFLVYGMRSGALIGVSSSKEVAEEFYNVNSYSNRGVWSNGTRGAQRLLAQINQDSDLTFAAEKERNAYKVLIEERASIFLKEAQEVGLVTCPYKAGFFITVPAKDPRGLAERLKAVNIFVVPLKKGIRFAVCSVPTRKIAGLASRTKEALEQLQA
ncbi:aminotransferase [Clostridiales bacterium PH28_bin88]|nr:aminotransferase [Clostridiales bacterium PH28_bin88]